ncbi:MAG: aminopeptidase P family protein [Ruminococcaceae bacterium]|nr:aminopeptidase P family protein [Oscillospiraceae bacterium]
MSMYPVIPREEFAQRIAATRVAMAKENVDLLMGFSNLLDPSCVRYYTDFAAVNESAAIIIPAEGEVTLCSGQAGYDYAQVMNKLDGSIIKIFPEIGEVSGFEYDTEGQLDFEEYFLELKSKYNVKKIALVGKLTFPAVIYNKLTKVFDGAQIIDFDEQHYAQRLIKTPAELEVIRKCCQIISQTFDTVVPKITKGMTERELQAMLEGEMIRLGGESYVQAFAPMVATGPKNSFISMCRNTLRQIQESEIINMGAGVCYEGYNGVICTPYVLGEVPEKMKDAIRCAYEALNVAAKLMKPGVPCDVILNAYTDYLTKKGYIDYCPYGSLHSTGLLECEAPVFSVANKRVIQENMAICIDAYFKGMEWGSFRVEDVYIIGKDGAERVTTYNDKFLAEFLK